MSALSDYAENLLANYLANTEAVTRPTTWRLALFTAAPSDAGGGTEVSGAGYARQAVTFGAASGGQVANTGALTFTASGGAFGTITHFGVFDAASAGNLLFHGAWATPRTIADGESFTVAVGALSLTLA